MPDSRRDGYDAVVVGSGFGGTMAAHALLSAGARVLVLERGDWLPRGPQLWDDVRGFFQLTPAYTRETEYEVRQRRGRGGEWKPDSEGIVACVGGPSLFYGGASFRFRLADFAGATEIVGDSGARWPFGYDELEPYYAQAEQLLGIAGSAGEDPTEAARSGAYPAPAAPLSPISARIADAARRLGLHPFRVPLALNPGPVGPVCVACITCDGYACAIGAKNDLATRVLEPGVRRGLELRSNVVVTRLVEEAGRISAVEGVDRVTGERLRFHGDRVILSAGALASPHLLLASGLERLNPAGHLVGRNLMRHCNAFVYGVFASPPDPGRRHHKQIAIHDFYLGDPGDEDAPVGKLGNIQQVMTPQTGAALRWTKGLGRGAGVVQRVLAPLIRLGTRHLTGLQVIAEDQPNPENRVEVDWSRRDRFGLPAPVVVHEYSDRDLCSRAALVRRASEVLREAGAWRTFPYRVTTFSHAVGTVRMGSDPEAAPLDDRCRFRGIENLYVIDGSFMPTSGGVNPSLTIAANALRVGALLAAES
jgi:choline dehydrogenase-like flavoprotein